MRINLEKRRKLVKAKTNLLRSRKQGAKSMIRGIMFRNLAFDLRKIKRSIRNDILILRKQQEKLVILSRAIQRKRYSIYIETLAAVNSVYWFHYRDFAQKFNKNKRECILKALTNFSLIIVRCKVSNCVSTFQFLIRIRKVRQTKKILRIPPSQFYTATGHACRISHRHLLLASNCYAWLIVLGEKGRAELCSVISLRDPRFSNKNKSVF